MRQSRGFEAHPTNAKPPRSLRRTRPKLRGVGRFQARKRPNFTLRMLNPRVRADLTGSGADLTGSGADLTGSGADLTWSGADLTGSGADLTGSGLLSTLAGMDSILSGADSMLTGLLSTLTGIDWTWSALLRAGGHPKATSRAEMTKKRARNFLARFRFALPLCGYAACKRAALSTFCSSEIVVIGPVPPGIGVMAPAICNASSKSTLPTMVSVSPSET